MQELVEEFAGQMVMSGWKMATAESCTGGMVAEALTEVPGSSNYFDRAFVTYSNQAKTDMLGVPKDMLSKHGAVSPQVAQAMLDGVFKKSKVDLAIAITGVAGPQGGSDEKPVGLVYIGTALRGGKKLITKNYFTGDRETIRRLSAAASIRQALLQVTDPT